MRFEIFMLQSTTNFSFAINGGTILSFDTYLIHTTAILSFDTYLIHTTDC